MAERPLSISFDVANGQPLIGVPLEEDGHQVVRYFNNDADADVALAQPDRRSPRQLAGAWLQVDPDLDWDGLADELDRIRHQSTPTPLTDLDV